MSGQTVYIVQAITWEYSDEWFYRNGDQPIKAFLDPAAAEAHRTAEEWIIRKELMHTPPRDEQHDWPNHWSCHLLFTFGSLPAMTSLSIEEFDKGVAALGIPSASAAVGKATEDFYYDEQWWVNAWNTLQPDRAGLLWDMLDRLRFYEVVPMEVTE